MAERDPDRIAPTMTDKDIDLAFERGRIAREIEPRAIAARYDAEADRIVVELENGASFAFPPALAEGLCNASPAQLAEVEILGRGSGLHWETIDLNLSVPRLVAGVFGTAKWMAAHAGRATSPAKAAAARVNGAKGGRPRGRVGKPG